MDFSMNLTSWFWPPMCFALGFLWVGLFEANISSIINPPTQKWVQNTTILINLINILTLKTMSTESTPPYRIHVTKCQKDNHPTETSFHVIRSWCSSTENWQSSWCQLRRRQSWHHDDSQFSVDDCRLATLDQTRGLIQTTTLDWRTLYVYLYRENVI